MAYTRVDDNGLVIYGASGLGACSQALLLDRLGVTGDPPPDWLAKAYSEGNDNEQIIVDMLRTTSVFHRVPNSVLEKEGYTFGEWDEDRGVDYSSQVRVEAKVIPGVVVRSHLDGIVELVKVPEGWTRDQDHDAKRFVLEVKAFGDSYWQTFQSKGLDGFPGYKLQVTAQMKGAGLPAIFCVGHKDKNGKVYEIKYEIVDDLPVKWMEVIGKINEVEKRIKDSTLDGPDCELPLMYPCPYWRLHDPDLKGVPVMLSDENSELTERTLLISLGEEYERHKAAEKHHKELKTKAAQGVQEWFDGKGLAGEKVEVGYWEIEDYKQPMPGGLDEEKMVKDGVEVEKYRKPGWTMRYPKVKKRNSNPVEIEGKKGK